MGSKEAANPLLGSVHDPIYQGAKRDFVDGAVPEPKWVWLRKPMVESCLLTRLAN